MEISFKQAVERQQLDVQTEDVTIFEEDQEAAGEAKGIQHSHFAENLHEVDQNFVLRCSLANEHVPT